MHFIPILKVYRPTGSSIVALKCYRLFYECIWKFGRASNQLSGCIVQNTLCHGLELYKGSTQILFSFSHPALILPVSAVGLWFAASPLKSLSLFSMTTPDTAPAFTAVKNTENCIHLWQLCPAKELGPLQSTFYKPLSSSISQTVFAFYYVKRDVKNRAYLEILRFL